MTDDFKDNLFNAPITSLYLEICLALPEVCLHDIRRTDTDDEELNNRLAGFVLAVTHLRQTVREKMGETRDECEHEWSFNHHVLGLVVCAKCGAERPPMPTSESAGT